LRCSIDCGPPPPLPFPIPVSAPPPPITAPPISSRMSLRPVAPVAKPRPPAAP
jgi:hypothetical protein